MGSCAHKSFIRMIGSSNSSKAGAVSALYVRTSTLYHASPVLQCGICATRDKYRNFVRLATAPVDGTGEFLCRLMFIGRNTFLPGTLLYPFRRGLSPSKHSYGGRLTLAIGILRLFFVEFICISFKALGIVTSFLSWAVKHYSIQIYVGF